MQLIDVYYDLSLIMQDDLDILVDAIKEYTGSTKMKLEIKRRLEKLSLSSLEAELNDLYDVDLKVLKKYCFNRQKIGTQTSIYDFM